MNGHFDLNGNDDDMDIENPLAFDNRNNKFKARGQHVPIAMAKKSFNHKNMSKILKKVGAKEEREQKKFMEKQM